MSDYSAVYSKDYSWVDSDFKVLSGGVSFNGVATGTDYEKIIDYLVQIESIQKNRLEAWKQTWEAKIDSMTSLNQRLNAIEEAAGAMDTEKEFMATKASSSDSTVVTAATSTGAVNGAYVVDVGEDVKHIMASQGVADAATTAYGGAGGTMTIDVNGTTANVAITAGWNLTQIRDAINASAGTLVEASIENDGTGSNPYRLVMKSKTGGDDGRISVTNNPTDLSFGSGDIVMQDTSSWTGPAISLAGQYTGDKADGSVAEYDFTVQNVTGSGEVGADSFELSWTRTWDGGAPSAATVITVPADYTPGDSIEVEEGVFVQLESGTVTNGDTFTVRAYANDIDDAEADNWNGPAISTGGNYLGSVNKTYTFTAGSDGTIQSGGGADTVVIRWEDSLGNTGTISVDDSDDYYEVEQGVKIKLDAGGIVNGEMFQVNVYTPDKQQGQDNGLSQAAKVVHSGFGDAATSAVTTGAATFSYTYGGETITVGVDAGSTLSQLATTINDDSDNPGVSASIVNDGLGLPNSFKLVLTGEDTGADKQITGITHDFSGSSFGSGGEAGGGFSTSQVATNSMIKVDGFPAETDQYLQRRSNQVDDVITGVTLDLHNGGHSVVTVSTDTAQVYAKIEALINAVNYTQAFIRQETTYDETHEDTGVMIGNYSYYILKSKVDTALNTGVSGLGEGSGVYTHLSQIGIHTDPEAEGSWVIDQAVLNKALNENMEGVANLFIKNEALGTIGVASRTKTEMEKVTDSETGTLNVLISNYRTITAGIDSKIDREEDRIALYRKRQELRFARLETSLSQLNGQAAQLESAIKQLPNNSSK